MSELVLLLQAASTLAMVGLIWFVQIVHYPMFANVGREVFTSYERIHQTRTTWVVAPTMLVEAGTAALLLVLRPAGVSYGPILLGAVLLVMVWLSTFLLQVPAHAKLGVAFSEKVHRWLVRSNWLRTIGWTARGLLVCWMIAEALQHARTSQLALVALRMQ